MQTSILDTTTDGDQLLLPSEILVSCADLLHVLLQTVDPGHYCNTWGQNKKAKFFKDTSAELPSPIWGGPVLYSRPVSIHM